MAHEGLLGDRCIVPGSRVGAVVLGMRYEEVLRVLGPGQLAVRDRLAFLRYPLEHVEIVLRTPVSSITVDGASVIAIAVTGGVWEGVPRPDDRREFVEESLGEATVVGERALYKAGVSVLYEGSGRVATIVVRAPFLPDLFPAPRVGLKLASRLTHRLP